MQNVQGLWRTMGRLLLTTGMAAALLGGCGGSDGEDGGGAPPVAAPAISSQPQPASVSDGQPVGFSVVVSGEGLSYQWQKDAADVTGATTDTLAIAAAALADTGASYRVVISNSGGSITSNAATLTVTPVAPSITSQPAALIVTAGAAATFSVAASGSAPLAYQWQRNGVDIADATAASYTLNPATLGDSGATFAVRVSNAAGPVTSAEAVLTVTAAPMAPSIATQPQSAAVGAGQPVSFSVVAGGTAPLAYQWRRNGTAIVGATGATLSIESTAAGDNGAVFSVLVSNSAGSATSASATLTVNTPTAGSGTGRLTFGTGHVLAVRADGSVIAWGLNNAGQLGNGAAIAGTNARAVAATATAVAAGAFESLALGSDGIVRGWGRKFGGSTIIGGDAAMTGTDMPSPGPTAYPGSVTHLVTGSPNGFGLVRRSDGTVWHLPGTATPIPGGFNQAARQVGGLSGVASLGGGSGGEAMAIRNDGTVWRIAFLVGPGAGSWQATATPVSGLEGVAATSCNGVGCIALTSAGEVLSFAGPGGGAPVAVAGLPKVQQIATGGLAFQAVSSDGRLWRWNSGATPVVVAGLSGVAEVAGGLQSVLVRLVDGSVWGYGQNMFGELGAGTPATTVPVQVPGINLN